MAADTFVAIPRTEWLCSMVGESPTMTGPTTGWFMSLPSPMAGVTIPSSIPKIGVEGRRWCGDWNAVLLASESSGVVPPGEDGRLLAGVWKSGMPRPSFCA